MVPRVTTMAVNIQKAAERSIPRTPRRVGKSRLRFPIVVIGVSAGGLEALTALLEELPPSTGMAFVLVLQADRGSILSQIKKMPVLEVANRMGVKRNYIYLTPPNRHLAIRDRVFRLTLRKGTCHLQQPFDDFAISLAEEQGNTAVGVMLSGTEDDGTAGLRAIQAAGGITFALEPAAPSSTVGSGAADFVLSAKEIAGELARIGNLAHAGDPSHRMERHTFEEVCSTLLAATGVDFGQFKQQKVERQISRRMALRQIASTGKYVDCLGKDHAEARALADDIFLHVTGFFRDPSGCDALRRRILTRYRAKHDGKPFQIWVAGCSTGEEVYSLAILLIEELGDGISHRPVQIFGTDIQGEAVARAREGIYTEAALRCVSEERRQRFFLKVDQGFQVTEQVRERCIFARHDLANDPPLTEMDLIRCCNVLSDFSAKLQQRILANFEHGLRPGGLLFLGHSEPAGEHSIRFAVLDGNNGIFTRRPESTAHHSYKEQAEAALLEFYAPPAIIVDSELRVLHFQGDTSPYLAVPQGEPGGHLFQLVRSELLMELRRAFSQVKRGRRVARSSQIEVRLLAQQDDEKQVFLVVFRESGSALHPSARGRHLTAAFAAHEPAQAETRQELLSLQDELRQTHHRALAAEQQSEAILNSLDAQIALLDSTGTIVATNDAWTRFVNENGGCCPTHAVCMGLNYLDECKRAVSRGACGAKAALDGLTDVLEGRRGSFELEYDCHSPDQPRWFIMTVSPLQGEMRGAVVTQTDITQRKLAERELAEQRSLVDQIIAAAPGAVCAFRLAPDKSISLKWASAGLERMLPGLFNLATSSTALFEALHPDDAERVRLSFHRSATTMTPWREDFRIRTAAGNSVSVEGNFVPQADSDNASITWYGFLVDVSEQINTRAALVESQSRLAALMEHAADAIYVHNLTGRFVDVNRQAYENLGYSREELMHLTVFDIEADLSPDEIRKSWAILEESATSTAIGRHKRKDGTLFPVEVSISITMVNGERLFLAVVRDVSARLAGEQALLEAQRDYRSLVDNSPYSISRVSADWRYLFVNRRLLQVAGMPEESFIGKHVTEVGHPARFLEAWMEIMRRVAASGKPETMEASYPTADGESYWEVSIIPEFGPDGTLQSFLRMGYEITPQRRAEAIARTVELAMQERDRVISTMFDTAAQAIFGVDVDGRIVLANRMTEEMFGYGPGELIGKIHEILLPEELREIHVKHRETFFAAPVRRTMTGDLKACRKDGSLFPVEVSLSYVNTSQGFMAVSFVTDISARQAQEKALRRTEAQLTKLSEALRNVEEQSARQFARELHDDVTQRLGFLSMEIGKAAATVRAENMRQTLRSYQSKVAEIAESIRKISHRMHPAILEDLGLAAAVQALCRDLERAEGTPVLFRAQGVPDELPRSVAYTLYRVAQESLYNIAKHAAAGQVEVSLSCDGVKLELSIHDTGIGFDPSQPSSGLGVDSMRYRVHRVNGALSIESTLGKGTRIVATVPLQQ